jgi:rhodanese-related sulfurtransferase
MCEVDLGTFAAAVATGATVVDVRQPSEYTAGHVPGARLVPLAQIPTRVEELRSAAPVYVICASGARSLTAAQFLIRAGVDARSVSGGTGEWVRSGRTVVLGQHAWAS